MSLGIPICRIHRIEQFSYLHRYCQPDFMLQHDDWGSQQSMYLSPDMWRKIFKEPERRMVEHAHSLGMKYVHHSCGKIDPIIEDFVEIGIDGWHSVQSINDLDHIKRTYGDRLVFLGGVDSQVTDVPGTSEDAVREEVRRAINTLGKDGGYMCSSSVMFSTIPTVEELIIDEAVKYGHMVYQ